MPVFSEVSLFKNAKTVTDVTLMCMKYQKQAAPRTNNSEYTQPQEVPPSVVGTPTLPVPSVQILHGSEITVHYATRPTRENLLCF